MEFNRCGKVLGAFIMFVNLKIKKLDSLLVCSIFRLGRIFKLSIYFDFDFDFDF